MEATSQLTEKQLLAIIQAHYKAKGMDVRSVSIQRYETNDPREISYGYVTVSFTMPDL